MDSSIFILLVQDGLTTGAIYLLLAIGLLIVFSVSGVIFIPQGDFVSFAALGFAGMLQGEVPGTLWLLDGAALVCAALAFTQPRPWRAAAWSALPAAALTVVTVLAVRIARTSLAARDPGRRGHRASGRRSIAWYSPLPAPPC